MDNRRHGANRQRQSLFIPRFLKTEADDFRLRGPEQERAKKIMRRWAELEFSGKLNRMSETKLEGEFLSDVFGKALGYTLFSEDKDEWNIEAKFSVNGGVADAAIGRFESGQKKIPDVLIEFKGPKVDLDRDRFNGRTAVQQCWDYLNAVPECEWGVVCNYVSFRLYHRSHSSRIYQLFLLQDLVSTERFRQFYYLFERGAFIPVTATQKPRAISLLEKSNKRQREVGDELYQHYNENRLKLIQHLMREPYKRAQDKAIRITQKLLDRIIFVAFCEDRNLLPENSLEDAYSDVPPFTKVTNPRWQNFLDLFRSIDEGNERRGISPYDGGLFRKDDDVDNLELDDDWTGFFKSVGRYDFQAEVSVDVLGHLFEKSINDIERLRTTRIFEIDIEDKSVPQMAKSVERKRGGIYYTPPEFTSFIVDNAVARLIEARFSKIQKKMKLTDKDIRGLSPDPKVANYLRRCYDTLCDIKIVDPACGSGAFLIKAYDVLEEKYQDIIDQLIYHGETGFADRIPKIPELILRHNLHGVDVSREAVEITQLSLWIRSAQKGKSLADLSKNIVCGNSLVDDPDVHPNAMKWEEAFPDVFSRKESGFDCVIGNPPWERMKLQEREFFDTISPKIAAAVNAATRRKLIEELKEKNPELHEKYLAAKADAEKTLDYVRNSDRYPLTGKGDINTYAVFAELAYNIVAPNGRVGLLVPSGIATDHTTQDYFRQLVDSKSLIALYDFENKAPIFPDVHRSFKLSVLLFGGNETRYNEAEFTFFAHSIHDLIDEKRHVSLSSDDIKLLNPNTRTCPIFRSERDAELTKEIYKRVPVLIDKSGDTERNPWGIRFMRMFDQTNDAELFVSAEQLLKKKYKRVSNYWKKGKTTYLPLYEAKMIQMYDHRAASVIIDSKNWMRQGQPRGTTQAEHKNAEYNPEPRWWVDSSDVSTAIKDRNRKVFIAYKDVTSPTNQRTMIASFIPYSGVLNSAPLIFPSDAITDERKSCLLANLNSIAFDYVARQKVGGVHLNFYIVEQLPIFGPAFYEKKCRWDKRQTLEKWISDRVLKLTCTSNDMIPLAESAGFDPPVHRWDAEERTHLMAELDAAYFLLYGIKRDDVEYILSTFSGIQKEAEGLLGVSSTYDLILKYYDELLK